MRSRSGAAAVALLLMVFGVAACTGKASSKKSTSATPATPYLVGGSRTLTGNELSFGPSIGIIPGAVYQPDVVLIGGGANAIVGAQDNGLVWTVKGNAPGASQLAVGKIMAATAFATGRVEQVQRAGGVVKVVLAPVSLTDVFKQLDITSSTPVALDQPMAYSYGNSPTTATDGDGGVTAVPATTSPTVVPTPPDEPHLWSGPAPQQVDVPNPPGIPAVELPEPSVSPKAVQQGKFSLTPYCCYPSEGVHIAYNEPAGRMAATVGIVMGSKPLVDFHLYIDTGGIEEAVFELNGPKAIEFQFDAATTDVSGNYQSPTLRVPFAFTFPIGGIPFTVSLTQSVRASIQLAGQAAFSSKGEYAISGGLGFAYRNGKFGAEKPVFSTQLSSIENATSLSVGINALSMSYGAQFSVGIGVLGFNGGPYFNVEANLAIDKDGSPPQTSLTAGCATAAVYVNGTFGVGYTIPEFVAEAVNKFLSLFNAKPIKSTGGPSWGPYTLWNPGPGTQCLKRS